MHKTFSTDGSNSIGKWYPRTCLEKSFVIDSENILNGMIIFHIYRLEVHLI